MLDHTKLLNLYPEYTRVYGPYKRPDGRQHIVIYSLVKGRKTISWPKALVEVREGRRLADDETVDHDDRDFTNDSLTNLVVRTRAEHARLDAVRVEETAKCKFCLKSFTLTYSQRNSRSKSRNGPYCSKVCSGKDAAKVNAAIPQRTEVNRKEFYVSK